MIVDNTAPTVTMTDPGTPLRGTVTLAATATDAHSGIAQVVIQRQASGASTWTDVCTTTAAPYRCSLDTTTLAEGNWSFRAQATDAAGNSTNSAAVTNRLVENIVSTVSLEDPGTELYGTVTLRATAASTAGVTRVRDPARPRRRHDLDRRLHRPERPLHLHLEHHRRSPTRRTT